MVDGRRFVCRSVARSVARSVDHMSYLTVFTTQFHVTSVFALHACAQMFFHRACFFLMFVMLTNVLAEDGVYLSRLTVLTVLT